MHLRGGGGGGGGGVVGQPCALWRCWGGGDVVINSAGGMF